MGCIGADGSPKTTTSGNFDGDAALPLTPRREHRPRLRARRFGSGAVGESEIHALPDRLIFDRAVARLGVMPWECCHVGDHPEVDVSGARAAGLRAIWKRTAYWGMPAESVPVIENLGEVLLYT